MTFSAQTFVSLCTIVLLLNVFLGAMAYMIMLERKIASWTQDRIGPNRVGFSFGGLFGLWDLLRLRFMNTFHFWGLGQPLADGVKMLMKEDFDPRGVDRSLFYLAPVMALVPAMIGWAVIPFGGSLDVPAFSILGLIHVQAGVAVVSAAPLNVGVIYILATGSLAVYGITVGGWASNNKFSFLGGLRATAQMLSYEIPMGLIVLCVLLMTGSAAADGIVNHQAGYWMGFVPSWNIVQQPIAAVLFFICLLAENNRTPFDLAECEQELVGGFHTEYSSMKFALFFLGEYLHMITAMAFFTLMFLGGWHLPWVDYLLYGSAQPAVGGVLAMLLKAAVFFGKMFLLVWLVMQVRWTLPRFRFDQLMRLAWRGMIPVALLLLLATGTLAYLRLTNYLWIANLAIAALTLIVAPLMASGGPMNRRLPLAGSRFSPLID